MTIEANTYESEQFAEDVINPNPTYAFVFESIGAAAVEVFEVLDDGTRVRVENSDFTVVFGGIQPIFDGGTVEFTRPHPGDLFQVSIERNTPMTQTVDFQSYGRFPSNLVEFALDKLTMIAQEIAFRKCDSKDP